MKKTTLGLLLTIFLYQACTKTDKPTEQMSTDEKSTSTEQASADSTASQEIEVSLTQEQYTMANVQLGQPAPKTLSSILKVNGTIEVPPNERATISVPYGGYVRSLNHDLLPGQRVSKGQTIIVLENPEFIQLQQDYLETKAKLEYAEQEYQRQQELSRENVGAQKVFQQISSERQRLQAQLAGQAQRLSILRINPATLRADRLTRTVSVPAPVSGYLTVVNVNIGKYVNAADVIAEITNIEHPHLTLSVFERNIGQLRIGQPVRFAVGQDAQPIHQAKIILIGKEISSEHTIEVHAHPTALSEDIIPGAYVSAVLDVKSQAVSALPESAVVSFSGKSYVYVLIGKQKGIYQFKQVPVQPGIAENGFIAVNLPAEIDPKKTPIVVNGAYSLLSKLNNQEEEE